MTFYFLSNGFVGGADGLRGVVDKCAQKKVAFWRVLPHLSLFLSFSGFFRGRQDKKSISFFFFVQKEAPAPKIAKEINRKAKNAPQYRPDKRGGNRIHRKA